MMGWKRAVHAVVCALALVSLTPRAHAAPWCTGWFANNCNGFEGYDYLYWYVEAGGSFDLNAGLALDGTNNGWLRGTTGWHAMRRFVFFPQTSALSCTAYAWIRTSPGLTGGLFSMLSVDGSAAFKVLGEKSFNAVSSWENNGYVQISVNFTPPSPGMSQADVLRISFTGNGTDQWVQIDDTWINCVPPY